MIASETPALVKQYLKTVRALDCRLQLRETATHTTIARWASVAVRAPRVVTRPPRGLRQARGSCET